MVGPTHATQANDAGPRGGGYLDMPLLGEPREAENRTFFGKLVGLGPLAYVLVTALVVSGLWFVVLQARGAPDHDSSLVSQLRHEIATLQEIDRNNTAMMKDLQHQVAQSNISETQRYQKLQSKYEALSKTQEDQQKQPATPPEVQQESSSWSSLFQDFLFAVATKVLVLIILYIDISVTSAIYQYTWKDDLWGKKPLAGLAFLLAAAFPAPFLVMVLVGWSVWLSYALLATIEILILIGWMIEIMWEEPCTFLHWAAFLEMPLMASVLLKTICDVNATGPDGRTPLDLAEEFKNPAVAAVLERNGGRQG